MPKAISVLQKKKRGRGRPATGRDPIVNVRLSEDLISEVDEWASENRIETRSAAIRELIELGLGQKSKK